MEQGSGRSGDESQAPATRLALLREHGWPYPAGSLVFCQAPDGLYARERCKSHIFRVYDPIEVDYAEGWVQSAECLVCEDRTQPIDASFWSRRATEADRMILKAQLDSEIERLRKVQAILGDPGRVAVASLVLD